MEIKHIKIISLIFLLIIIGYFGLSLTGILLSSNDDLIFLFGIFSIFVIIPLLIQIIHIIFKISKKKNKKQKNKKIMKNLFFIITILTVGTSLTSCTRIDAGHVGIKVKLTGSGKGVQDITEVTGWTFYNPLAYSVYEFPTFIQHKEYTDKNAFVVNSKDGSEFHVSPVINYSIKSEKVTELFKKYRRDLKDIEEGFLKTSVYDAFRLVANSYTADSLISSREIFEIKIKKTLTDNLEKDGFIISQFTSNLSYPKTFKKSIEAKNAAVQKALQADNEVRTAEAQAKIKVAKVQGQANALRIQADADAYANTKRQETLTPILIQQQFIEKWNGKLPIYGTVPTIFKDISK
jgi:regulator of protease activity HflC (stomatin/prohibitin superfamily)